MNGDELQIRANMETGANDAGCAQHTSRLDSWKAIATFLNRSVRTVQRWERLEGMPVRRHVHESGESVFACSHELENWRAKRTRLGRRDTRTKTEFAPIVALALAEKLALRSVLEAILHQLGDGDFRPAGGSVTTNQISPRPEESAESSNGIHLHTRPLNSVSACSSPVSQSLRS